MFENVKVKDWMTTEVITCTAKTPISEAHKLMKEYGIRRLPVVDGDTLIGIITIGDVREASPSDATTLSIWELNYLWAQLTAEKVMTRKVVTVTADSPMSEVARLMLELKISGIPVVDASNRVVGVVTESDIFKMIVKTHVAT